MEREPDRDGYRDFCNRVDSGDHELAQKAEIDSLAGQRSALGLYDRMRKIEHAIERASNEDPGDIIHGYEMTAPLQKLSSNRVRMEALGRMQDAAASWDAARRREMTDHREFHRGNDLRYALAERRAEHPRETEGQAWFKAKLEVESAHLSRMISLRTDLGQKLDGIARQAAEKDRSRERER
jgi:hypothetical protein